MLFDYTVLLNSKAALFAYILLSASIVSLWLKRSIIIFGGLLSIAILLALFSHRLQWPTLFFIGFFGGINYLTFNIKQKLLNVLSSVITLTVSVLLWFHAVPGFSNWLIAKNLFISADAVPFTIFLNFDKPLIGLFILGFSSIPLLHTWQGWYNMLKKTLPIALVGSVLIAGSACLLGYIKFDPKMNTFFILWALNNLLLTCIAEEALFRGWIQRSISATLKYYRYGDHFALVIAAVLFGLIHWGNLMYITLATFAGLLYGFVYQKTKNIEASIMAHFLLNVLHFVGFTYPALA
jgi:membrane protease YdiL (CAAX protease family)